MPAHNSNIWPGHIPAQSLSQRLGVFGWLLTIVFMLSVSLPPGVRASATQDRLTPIQREIERQQQRLGSLDAEERRDALMRLGNLKRPEASRAAAAALNDGTPVVRVTAAHAILSLPPREASALLTPMLKDKSEFVRREVASVLGETRDVSAVGALSEALLHDKKASVRGAAAVALGVLGDESAVISLTQVLTTARKKRSDEDEFVMRSAARSLGQIRSRSALPALIATLENSANPLDTRREAATALGLIGDASALPALQAAFAADEDPYLSEAARLAIKRLAPKKN